jgi:amino acid adenylation domain-containing protein/thioester reductase-like protein
LSKSNSSSVTQALFNRVLFIPAFESIVAKYPDNAAVIVAGEVAYTYAQLAARARSIALKLQSEGVQPGDIVGISIVKSADYICAMLAIWYAGAAFVPMDPALPVERLHFMVDEASVKIVVVNDSGAASAVSAFSGKSGVKVLYVSDIDGGLPGLDSASGFVQSESKQSFGYESVGPNDLAYLIFTSGSTGRPKGVLVTHRGIVSFLDAQISAFDLDSESRSLWYLSTSFDASVSDLGTAFLSGAAICIEPPEQLQPGNGLEQILADRAITYVDIPPSILRLLDPAALPPSFKTIVIGGEACALDVVRTFAATVKLVNVYGPTESTVCTSLGQCGVDWSRPLIGLPLPGITYHLLDEDLNEITGSEPGQLHIGGIGLARGYLNRPDLTEAKFIEHPLTDERLYRTGDLVMRTEDGQYKFLGRTDRQVKLRGMLVEPEEIEARLLQFAGVKRAAVLKRPVKAGVAREILVAFVEPNNDSGLESGRYSNSDMDADLDLDYSLGLDLSRQLDLNDLRDHLAQVLPKWMLPQRIEVLNPMPLTVTGKVDLSALRLRPLDQNSLAEDDSTGSSLTGSDSIRSDSTGTALIGSLSATERLLTQVYKQVLGVDSVGKDDHFFDLGGDSFAVVEACVVASALGLALPPTLLIAHPVVAELALELSNLSREQSGEESSELSLTASGGMLCSDICKDISLTAEFEQLLDVAAARKQVIEKTPANIFLTGATGFLGARLLSELLQDTNAQIHCLVRADSEEAGLERIEKALGKHGLSLGDDSGASSGTSSATNSGASSGASFGADRSRLRVICGSIEITQFGLSDLIWNELAEQVDTVYHCAAQVNNLASYAELRQSNVVGTQEVVRLLCAGRSKCLHYISTLSVFVATDKNQGVLLESDHLDDTSIVYGGYAQTKWAAEVILRSLAGKAGPITYHRLGLITGDSVTGKSADHDFLNLFVNGLASLGCAPEVSDEISVDITPVDYAAKAVIKLSLAAMARGKFDTYHIANSKSLTLKRLLAGMQAIDRGVGEVAGKSAGESVHQPFEIVSPSQFQKQLLSRVSILGGAESAACMALCRLAGSDFEFFRTMDLFQATDVVFDDRNTKSILEPLGIVCPEPSGALLQLYLKEMLG